MLALTTRVHGTLDLAIAVVAIASPWLFGFSGAAVALAVVIAAGVILIGYSLLTDYERGLTRNLQLTLHLWLDGMLGLLLAISPWLFSFDQTVWLPHLVLGIVLILLAILSQTIPGYERRRARGAGPTG